MLCLNVGIVNAAPNTKLEPEQIAQEVVEDYLTNMKNKNFTEAIKLVEDSRYPDQNKQIQKYEDYSEETDFSGIKVIDTTKLTDKDVIVTIKEQEGNTNLNVIKKDNEWKLMLGDGDQATTQALNNDTFSITSAVAFYELKGLTNGTVLYSNNAFSVGASNSATIKGWQNSGIGSAKASFQYEVVQDVWNGWKPWSVPVTVTGNISQNSTSDWYTRSFNGIPAGSNYHIKFTGKTPNNFPADGAGNVYVN